jgi:hypothetical protein
MSGSHIEWVCLLWTFVLVAAIQNFRFGKSVQRLLDCVTPFDLQRQVQQRIVRVRDVVARQTLDLAAQVTAKDVMDQRRFFNTRVEFSI